MFTVNSFLIYRRSVFDLLSLDISTDQFPANYFDRHAIFYKNHDVNNQPLCKFDIRTFSNVLSL